MPLQAVLFDLWGTLIIDPPDLSRARQVWRAVNVRGVLTDNGIDVEFEAVDEALVAASSSLTAMHDEGRDVKAQGRVDLFFAHLNRDDVHALSLDVRRELEDGITAMHPELAPELA